MTDVLGYEVALYDARSREDIKKDKATNLREAVYKLSDMESTWLKEHDNKKPAWLKTRIKTIFKPKKLKKRIKLTEKELALAMWVYVYLKVTSAETIKGLFYIKLDYLEEHGYKNEQLWENNCIFCQRYKDEEGHCYDCPLFTRDDYFQAYCDDEDDWNRGYGCGTFSWYDKIYHYKTKEEDVVKEACMSIIQAIDEEIEE